MLQIDVFSLKAGSTLAAPNRRERSRMLQLDARTPERASASVCECFRISSKCQCIKENRWLLSLNGLLLYFDSTRVQFGARLIMGDTEALSYIPRASVRDKVISASVTLNGIGKSPAILLYLTRVGESTMYICRCRFS